MDQGIGEAERLRALYGGYSDAELLQLSREGDSLRPEAQTAVTEELSRRGLEYGPASEERETGFAAGVPGLFPSSAAVVEQALEPGGDVEAGMAELASFFDGHELTRACDALAAAGIEPAIRQREGNALTGAPAWFEVWVDVAETLRAQAVLREKLGLFPPAEGDAAGEPAEAEDRVAVAVAVMDTSAEAEAAVRQLRAAGLDAQVRSEGTGEFGVAVEVAAADRDRALEVLATGLSVDAGARS